MGSDPNSARLIELEGCLNFRDLGGYSASGGRRVRWGQLYRSDALHYMTERDVARVRDDLGVRAVIDLRASSEVRGDGIGRLPTPPVRYHHVPLFETGENPASDEIPSDLGHQYFLLLRSAQRPVSRVLELLADAEEPAVFHCAAGKDRTGVVSAVLLSLLGVDETDIVRDYVFTSRNLDRIIERLRRSPSYAIILQRLPPETLHAAPATMTSFLGRIRQAYGSMRAFALASGLSETTLTRLEQRLLEDPRDPDEFAG